MAVNVFFFLSLCFLSLCFLSLSVQFGCLVCVCVSVIVSVSVRLLLRHFKYYESNVATLLRFRV